MTVRAVALIAELLLCRLAPTPGEEGKTGDGQRGRRDLVVMARDIRTGSGQHRDEKRKCVSKEVAHDGIFVKNFPINPRKLDDAVGPDYGSKRVGNLAYIAAI